MKKARLLLGLAAAMAASGDMTSMPYYDKPRTRSYTSNPNNLSRAQRLKKKRKRTIQKQSRVKNQNNQ